MQVWLDTVGELPAKPAVALVDANKTHPLYGPFIRGLSYANATAFVSEKPQRQALIDAYDMVVLQEQTRLRRWPRSRRTSRRSSTSSSETRRVQCEPAQMAAPCCHLPHFI